ncbi:MAG: DUF2442 domain-containing protein [Deltaproteobacteria bacterium]|nr:DUF2442 domain-containing protein [Deltaproteobacteria bacterium]
MTQMKRPRLKAVEALTNHTLRLTFVNNRVYDVSFEALLNESPGLEPLRDPAAFSKATIIPGEGWTVEWPDVDIQIGADTLWLDAQAQNASDENARIFGRWRARHGLSLKDAAAALGVTPRTVSAYGTGQRPVPRYIALACKGWEAEQERNA